MLKTDNVIYHVETQEDLENLITNVFESNIIFFDWYTHKDKTCLIKKDDSILMTHLEVAKSSYPYYKIKKYKKVQFKEQNNMKVKLKADEKFIADWYEEHKHELDTYIYTLCLHHDESELWEVTEKENQMFKWLEKTDDFIQTLVRMHLFGYEIEKEPLYYIELPNLKNYKYSPQRICKNDNSENYFACGEYQNHNYKFTKEEIMNNFEWAWQFAREC